jgi:hypothetical protein
VHDGQYGARFPKKSSDLAEKEQLVSERSFTLFSTTMVQQGNQL